MYMVRKRFMYWQVPTTTKLHIRREEGEAYCFIPARLIKRVQKPKSYIVQRLLVEYSALLQDRQIRPYSL